MSDIVNKILLPGTEDLRVRNITSITHNGWGKTTGYDPDKLGAEASPVLVSIGSPSVSPTVLFPYTTIRFYQKPVDVFLSIPEASGPGAFVTIGRNAVVVASPIIPPMPFRVLYMQRQQNIVGPIGLVWWMYDNSKFEPSADGNAYMGEASNGTYRGNFGVNYLTLWGKQMTGSGADQTGKLKVSPWTGGFPAGRMDIWKPVAFPHTVGKVYKLSCPGAVRIELALDAVAVITSDLVLIAHAGPDTAFDFTSFSTG